MATKIDSRQGDVSCNSIATAINIPDRREKGQGQSHSMFGGEGPLPLNKDNIGGIGNITGLMWE
jgi:hypothetical protein